MKKYKVGIIGHGFVGEAQSFAFSPVADVYVYDVNPLRANATLDQVYECDFVFIAVPTPMYENGLQDDSYVQKLFSELRPGPIYIIKSTVVPGTTAKLEDRYPNLDIVFSPEFLTERTAKLDILTQARIIFGGSFQLTLKVEKLYVTRFKNRHFIHTDATTAELIKYMNNSFFATKVSMMNEYKRLSDKIGADWEDALHGFASDGRVGDSHLDVPGPDGKLGYGGVCFPKDVRAICSLARSVGAPLHTVEAGWKTNLEVRPEQDWLDLEGKAITKKKYEEV